LGAIALKENVVVQLVHDTRASGRIYAVAMFVEGITGEQVWPVGKVCRDRRSKKGPAHIGDWK